MLTKVLILNVFVLLTVHQSTAQTTNPSCIYVFDNNNYTCLLQIQNPNGLDNFLRIDGQHFPGFGNQHVRQISILFGSTTRNFPTILCDTFVNTISIWANEVGIEDISILSFNECRQLGRLDLGFNRISRIEVFSFINNLQLSWLNLNFNQIAKLPNNIFSPLTQLNRIQLIENRIEVVHAAWFGTLPNLFMLEIEGNGVRAVDRRILSAIPNVTRIAMHGNICATGWINTVDMVECFDNYDWITGDTTTVSSLPTTTPGQCVISDINQEVCSLRSDVNALENRVRILERIIAGFKDEIENLKASKE